MDPRPASSAASTDELADLDPPPAEPPERPSPEISATPVAVALEGLPIAGVTRRRVAFVAAALVTAWIVLVFARQVGEASAATGRADEAVLANARLTRDVAALQRELALVKTTPYILQQARAYRLGAPGEVAFQLAADAPPLGPDAPGSAEHRLGATSAVRSPLDSWLTLLFGSGPAH